MLSTIAILRLIAFSTAVRVVNMSNILIALIGDTGAGKTTFISQATGRQDLPIGRGIDSCKSHIPSPLWANTVYS